MTSRPRGSPSNARDGRQSGDVRRALAHSVNVHEGDLIAGKYRVEGVLGVGGTAVVVAARHEQLGHRVAIKLLSPSIAERPEMTKRFAREGQAAVRLTSGHVARVFDVGVLDDGTPYLVMEHLEGEDLEQSLQRRGALPVEQAVDFVMQACTGVAEAHGLGIVHRDLKPANLFCVLRDDGRTLIKVLDFGLAKASDAEPSAPDAATTRVGTIMGSPLYMSPEQMVASAQVDARTDLWALGVTLFELLAGRPPFDGSSISQIAHKVMTQSPPSMESLGAKVPPGLEAVIAKCLEKEPERRYAGAGELAAALRPFTFAKLDAPVEALAVAASKAALAPTVPVAAASARGPTTRRAAALIMALLIAIGVFEIVRRASTGSTPPVPTALALAHATTPPETPSEASSRAPDAVPANESSAAPPPEAAAPSQAHPGPLVRPPMKAAALRPPPPFAPTANACDPTFYLDELGRKHFKPECFVNR